MSEFHPGNPEKRTEKSEPESMSGVAEASMLLRQIAEPRPIGDTVKAAITRATRRVSRFARAPVSPGRIEDLWRQEARRVSAEEMDAIRAAAASDRKLAREANNALAEIDARIARLEALLIQDPDYYRDQVAAHIEALGGPDRSLDRGLAAPASKHGGEG